MYKRPCIIYKCVFYKSRFQRGCRMHYLGMRIRVLAFVFMCVAPFYLPTYCSPRSSSNLYASDAVVVARAQIRAAASQGSGQGQTGRIFAASPSPLTPLPFHPRLLPTGVSSFYFARLRTRKSRTNLDRLDFTNDYHRL